MQPIQRAAILTSGGDAPGMNAAVRAATRAALARGWEMMGVRNGYAGLITDEFAPLHARDVGGIIQRGGTVLGSARCIEFTTDAGRAQALANLRRRGIEALVVVGGNGSQTGASVFANAGFPVVGVASTVDNDMPGTDVTIGFGLRITTLGHVVRGGVPTAADRILATRLGAAAIDQLARGAPDMLVGVRGSDIIATPLAEVAGRTKGVDQALLELARVLAR